MICILSLIIYMSTGMVETRIFTTKVCEEEMYKGSTYCPYGSKVVDSHPKLNKESDDIHNNKNKEAVETKRSKDTLCKQKCLSESDMYTNTIPAKTEGVLYTKENAVLPKSKHGKKANDKISIDWKSEEKLDESDFLQKYEGCKNICKSGGEDSFICYLKKNRPDVFHALFSLKNDNKKLKKDVSQNDNKSCPEKQKISDKKDILFEKKYNEFCHALANQYDEHDKKDSLIDTNKSSQNEDSYGDKETENYAANKDRASKLFDSKGKLMNVGLWGGCNTHRCALRNNYRREHDSSYEDYHGKNKHHRHHKDKRRHRHGVDKRRRLKNSWHHHRRNYDSSD